jgi:hypothetical protein
MDVLGWQPLGPGSTSVSWLNDVSGLWSTALDWSSLAQPISSDDVSLPHMPVAYTVTVAAAAANPTVNSITIGTQAALSITAGTFTTLTGTGPGTNAGVVSVSGTGTVFDIDGSFVNAAAAGATPAGRISVAAKATVDLVGGSIAGGTVNIAAGGLLEATGGASASSISGAVVTDNGVLEATNDTVLTLANTTVNATISRTGATITGGIIEAVDAGVGPPPTMAEILLSNTTINGAALRTAAGGVIETVAGTNSTLNGVTIVAGTPATVVDNSTLTLKGIVTNAGTIALQSTGDLTELAIGSNVTLTGSGKVMLADVAPAVVGGSTNAILAAGATASVPFTLTNAPDAGHLRSRVFAGPAYGNRPCTNPRAARNAPMGL